MRRIKGFAAVLGAGLGLILVTTAIASPPPHVVVYVESQGLCYDSIVTPKPLPAEGRFQLLEPDSANHCGGPALKTAFGPRDQGYLGGRWILPDGTTFLCPLLRPGYEP
ncbi:MAG: hypothetical protein EXR50_04785 [Dehalococcoidia bacterium]|nr:hypothetical protein [Dehalococcoidia bacterium]